MKRKLVQQGNKALTLTLPIDWVEKNNLKKGQYVDITATGNELCVSARKIADVRKTELLVSSHQPFFKRYAQTLYTLGYDEISIKSNEQLPIIEITQAVQPLIGFEIVEQTSRKCLLKEVAAPDIGSLDAVLKRIFFLVETMLTDIKEALDNHTSSALHDISMTEQTINSFAFLSLRILNKEGYSDFKKTQYIYQTIKNLEEIGDALRDFCLIGTKEAGDVIIGDMCQYFIKLRELFFSYSMEHISQVKKKRLLLYKEARVGYKLKGMEDLYLALSLMHQLEVALDPLNAI